MDSALTILPTKTQRSGRNHRRKRLSYGLEFEGYRRDLRSRISSCDENSLIDEDIVEFVLLRLLPRTDTRPIARALLERFGSIPGILGAPQSLLTQVKGVNPITAEDIKGLLLLSQRYLKSQAGKGKSLGSLEQLISYCYATIVFEERRQLHAIFLNRNQVPVREECLQIGTVDSVAVYPRQIVSLALENYASYVILVSYYPWHDPFPSKTELEQTMQTKVASDAFGINLYDHVLIGKGGHFSMKEHSLL